LADTLPGGADGWHRGRRRNDDKAGGGPLHRQGGKAVAGGVENEAHLVGIGANPDGADPHAVDRHNLLCHGCLDAEDIEHQAIGLGEPERFEIGHVTRGLDLQGIFPGGDGGNGAG